MNYEQNIIEKEPRERILESAAELFAMRGFADVGVREIAERANVNVAMISYYFTNKAGIFKEIIRRYFDDMRLILDKAKSHPSNSEDAIKFLVHETVNLMKNKTFFCTVAITEMPFNLPEFIDFKAEIIRMHIEYVRQTLEVANFFIPEPKYQAIVGPAFISLLFSHFLFGPLIQKVWNIEIDDQFFERYKETISTILLYGLEGFKEMILIEKQGDK
ncbi:MAG: TetR/AcrR family transcriptional regulator [Candidatus Kapaibacteriales bacterium]